MNVSNTTWNFVLTLAYKIQWKAVHLQYFDLVFFHWPIGITLTKGFESFATDNNGDCLGSFSSWCTFTVCQFLPESLHSLRTSEEWVMLLFSSLSLKRVDALSSAGGLEVILLLQLRKGPRHFPQQLWAESYFHANISFIYWFWYKEAAPLSVVLN